MNNHILYSAEQDTLMTRSEIAQLETPPAAGRFHKPYAFGDYLGDVTTALFQSGLSVTHEEFAVNNNGQRLFGAMEVAPNSQVLEGELITSDEYKLLVGVRGSHDQSIARGLVLGSQVMVCSNLCFSGSLGKLQTKQTTHMGQRLPGLIRKAVANIPQLAQAQHNTMEAYKRKQIAGWAGDAALVAIYRAGGLGSGSQLTRAIKEWHDPSHEEHAQYDQGNGHSVWKLWNACTEALKPTGNHVNMDLVADRSQRVSNFIDLKVL